MTERIGSYHVVGKLGRGGMGEVLLGKDPRLDRQVAMKRIRLDRDANMAARTRFRREAQISASLNHPSIVHVHDLIEGDTEDVLVMEYVDGPNLRQYLEQSDLSVEDRMELAAQIAAGLAEAHRNGIVHRDLKTENVLISPTGRAKITDFGIALQSGKPQPQQNGRISGTYRAMSPEQAMGQELDFRSDLFSFGVLLYELFSGSSPFLVETAEETLHSIVNNEPKPLEMATPKLPKALTALIHHLLAKQPGLRPQHTQEVAEELGRLARRSGAETVDTGADTGDFGSRGDGSLTPVPVRQGRRRILWSLMVVSLILITVLWATYPFQKQKAEPVFVAVMKAAVHGTDEVPRDLLYGMREAAIEAMIGFKDLFPVDTDWIDEVHGRPSRVANAVAADEALVIKVRQEGARYIVVLRRISASDEHIIWSEALELHADEHQLILNGITAAIVRAYPHTVVTEEQPVVEASEFLAFLRLKRSFIKRELSLEEHLRQVNVLRKRLDHYAPVYLLESDVARFLYRATREDRYLAMSFELAEKGRQLAPTDQRPLETLINLSLECGDLDRARMDLEQLEQLYPGDIDATRYHALMLEQQGQSDQALAMMQRAVAARPAWHLQFSLANMAFRLGKTALARQTLHQMLEMEPDHPRYLRLLALVELSQGSPEQALIHYQMLTELAPSVTVWGNLGTTQMLLGHYAVAAESLRKALGLAPNNRDLYLNLADCLFLQGNEAEAAAVYRQVLALLDANPADVHVYTVLTRAQAQAHLGMKSQALATINQALEQAPKDVQVTYTAALVYAVLNERVAALAYAKQALELGNDPRWFGFPWFDQLRDDPIFNEMPVSATQAR